MDERLARCSSLAALAKSDAPRACLVLSEVPARDAKARGLDRVVELFVPGGGAWLIEACPGLRSVAITAPTDLDLGAIAKLPALEQLGLRYEISVAQLQALFDQMESPALTSLSLQDLKVGDKGAIALASHPRLASLDTLSLSTTGIGAKGAAALAEHLGGLTNLDLSYGSVKAAGFEAICAGAFTSLQRLSMYSQKIGDEPVPRLAAASFAPTLESLNLGKNGLSAAGVRALAEIELPSLRSLLLHGNSLADDVVDAIANARWFEHLERLTLRGRRLTPDGHARIAASTKFVAVLEGTGSWDADEQRVFR